VSARAPLGRDRRGVSTIEFALLAPVLFMVVLGLFDLMYGVYVRSVLEGAVVKAGRDSALENNAADQGAIDTKVRTMLASLGGGMTITTSRKSYASFSLVKPETFDDQNRNGVRDSGECFDDVNGNGIWDADPGVGGQGGANDVTNYTVTLTYNRIFPMAALVGWPRVQSLSASTLLKNQPYKTQTSNVVKSICT
jgi:Flp pilus assembly protein TadG